MEHKWTQWLYDDEKDEWYSPIKDGGAKSIVLDKTILKLDGWHIATLKYFPVDVYSDKDINEIVLRIRKDREK